MSRGNIQSIPTGTQTLQRTLNAEVRNAIRVLNPNDGIVYVAINGQASPVTFDFVVPSQSYAALPGPWMEYGLYFLDQSGAGRAGVVTVYESDERLDFPDYHAIGRSLQAQVTTLDITEGTQPPAPSVGVDRLWADNQGHVYSLLSDGTLRELAPLVGGKGGLLQLTDLINAPTAGKGLELFGYQPTPAGIIQAVNRDAGGTYIEIDIRGNPVRINPSGEGIVTANLDNRVGQSSTSKTANNGVWTIFNFQVDLPAPSSGNALWLLWWTAHFQDPTGNVYPYSIDTNLWTTQNPPSTLLGEIGARQFIQVTRSGGYYSCTGFGTISINAAQTVVLAAFPSGGNVTESPGVGGAFSRILGLRLS